MACSSQLFALPGLTTDPSVRESRRGPAATGVVALRNPDVARLEELEPQVYLVATYSMHMALDHSAISDLRQRARESGQLSQWQEEGSIVERWVKNDAKLLAAAIQPGGPGEIPRRPLG
jgi:hypothetical protein